MIRPLIDITHSDGKINSIYPPLQWNVCTSKRKITTDVREWLHSHHPDWASAMLRLAHYNRNDYNSYNETIRLERNKS
jgi:hypothetical protein